MMMLAFLSAVGQAADTEAPSAAAADTAATLLGRALASNEAWEELVELSDTIGHRLAGSESLARAVEWGAAEMAADGLVVSRQPVEVPVWIRGEEEATLLAPFERELRILTLGNSIGTPKKGITAEVVAVSSFEELGALGSAVAGKMVLWDVPFTSYGETVAYRSVGAIEAARLGAVASLLRSVTSESLHTPHTGAMRYEDGVPKIPAVALTPEDAAWLARLARSGKRVEVRLKLGAHFEDDGISHNVIGDVKGRELPEEKVVLGCHLDSWDVGQGAQDDGAGCTAVMHAAALIAALPTPPRRTVRVVLFTNEENGLRGARAYAETHGGETHVAAIEADTGGGPALGFRIDVKLPEGQAEARTKATIEALEPARRLLDGIDAGQLEASSWSGADIGPLVGQGTIGIGLMQDTTGYWPVHHSEADTVDKIDPKVHARNVAALAVLAWTLAELPEVP